MKTILMRKKADESQKMSGKAGGIIEFCVAQQRIRIRITAACLEFG